jgi:hypothetical protein
LGEDLQRVDDSGQHHHEDLGPDLMDGDVEKPLQPGRPIHSGRLRQFGVDSLQGGHEDDQRIADLEPNHNGHDRQ